MSLGSSPEAPFTIALLLSVGLLAAPGIGVLMAPSAVAEERSPDHERWGDADDSAIDIRPGVQIQTGRNVCTSNFLFEDMDTGDLFLGLAGHCVDFVRQPATIYGIDGSRVTTGEVAYANDHRVGNQDFALVHIPDATAADDRDPGEILVHPAVLHFGGPTGLANSSNLTTGEHIVAYGNSEVRSAATDPAWEALLQVDGIPVLLNLAGLGETNPTKAHEGYVTGPGEESSQAVLPTAMPGDSGSGILDAQGQALGVFDEAGGAQRQRPPDSPTDPVVGTHGFTNLDAAIQTAADETGMDLELKLWETLESGHLPEMPWCDDGCGSFPPT